MKRKICSVGLLLALLLVGCNKEEIDTPNELSNEITAFAPSLTVGDKGVFVPVPEKLEWQSDSKLSVFRGKNANEHFELAKGDGQNKATFNLVESVSTDAEELSSNIAICPYSPDYKLSDLEDSFEIQGITIPAEQKGEPLPMWAISDNSSYNFNLLCAIVEVNLSDFDKCDGVLIRALGDESLAGSCNLVINKEGSSSLNVISGASSVSSKEQISSNVYMVKVLPGTFTKGIYVEVLGSTEKSSKIFELSEFQAGKLYHLNGLIPGEYLDLNTFEEHGPQENNEIWVKTLNDKFPKSIDGYVLKRDADSDWWKYETEDGHEITKLVDELFYKDKLLTDIQLPSSITEIGASVFQYCDNLRNIVLPEGLLTIGGYSFYQCSSLKSIAIPSTVTSIGNYEFAYNTFDEFKFLPSPETFPYDVDVENTENTTLMLPHAWKYESGDRHVDAVDNTWMGATWKSITFIGEDDHLETGPQQNNEIWAKTMDNIIPQPIDGYIIKRDADSDWWKYETKDGQNITKLSDYLMFRHDCLTEIKLPSSITEIGLCVFQDCVNLRNIVLPEGLLAIGGYSIYNCTSLKSIEIPSTVTSIGNYEFTYDTFDEFKFLPSPETFQRDLRADNTENTVLMLPHAWKYELGLRQADAATNKWMGLKWKSITFIGEDERLETGPQENNEIWIKTMNNIYPKPIDGYIVKKDADSDWWKYETKDGHNLSEISSSMFGNYKDLIAVKIPTTVTHIHDNAFLFDKNLVEIELPVGLKSIGKEAFRSCTSLREISLPEGLESIGPSAFYYCQLLNAITIPSTVNNFSLATLSYTSLQTLTINVLPTKLNGVSLPPYFNNGVCPDLVLPHAWKYELGSRQANPVDNTWMACTWKSITFIGEDDRLETGPQENNEIWIKTMNNTVPKSIDGYIVKKDADSDWWKYEAKDGQTMTSLANELFYADELLTEIQLPSSIKEIGPSVFKYCANLRNIVLPEGLLTIGGYSFYGCTSLKSIEIPSTVISICDFNSSNVIFDEFKFLPSPETFKSAFRISDTENTVLMLPYAWKYALGKMQADVVANTWMGSKWKSITFIGEDDHLETGPQENNEIWVKTTNNTFPKAIDGYIIKRDADSDWWKYETEDGHNITKLTDGLLVEDNCLIEIKLPATVTEIGSSVFQNCANLRNIVLPEGLLTIGGYSFAECSSLTSIEIPSTVTSIGNDAFLSVYFAEFKFLPSPDIFQTTIKLERTSNIALSLPYSWKSESGERQVDAVVNTWMGSKWKSITLIGEIIDEETGPQENNEIWVRTMNNKAPRPIYGYIVKRDAGSDWWKYETEDGQNITKLTDGLLERHDCLTEIKLPATVTEIGSSVFQNCLNLRNIVLPEGLLAIGGYSLYKCTSLKSIEIPSTVTSIGSYEFTYTIFDEFKFLPSPETFQYDFSINDTENTALMLPHAWKYESGDRHVDAVANTWMGATWKSITFIGEDSSVESGSNVANFKY